MMASDKINENGASKFLQASNMFILLVLILATLVSFNCSASLEGGKGVRLEVLNKLKSSGIIGQHAVQVELGSRNSKLSLVLDTAIDLTWIQCQPCKGCSEQLPIFNYSSSETYSDLPCSSGYCSALAAVKGEESGPECRNSTSPCEYQLGYSYAPGRLGKDQLSFAAGGGGAEAAVLLNDFVFWCGNASSYLSGGGVEAGVMGLGKGGNLSILYQQAATYNENRGLEKCFSYCLTTVNGAGGHLTFGCQQEAAAVMNYTNFYKTPDEPHAMWYTTIVSAISVNGRKLNYTITERERTSNTTRNITRPLFAFDTTVETATPISLLPPTIYKALNDSFTHLMQGYPRAPPATSDPLLFDNCYNLTTLSAADVRRITPSISFTFGDNTVVDLDPSAVMYPVNPDNSQVCLAFTPNRRDEDIRVIGALQQQTLGVFFDLQRGRMGFKHHDCT